MEHLSSFYMSHFVPQAMGYIHKLQHHGMLKAVPVMDKFFSLLMEMSLEYCVQDLEKQEKEGLIWCTGSS